MDFFRDHLLSIITYTPLVGALLLLLPPFKRNDDAVRWVANVFGAARLPGQPAALVLVRPRAPPASSSWRRPPGSRRIGVQYHFGVDGISALLILLTTLLGFIAILSSWTAIHDRVRQYYVFLLLLQTGMLGVFCALDMFLFYVFWEVMLVPMYFLIGIWGGARRLYAAIKFFLYTLVGSVVMLLGILALYFHSQGPARLRGHRHLRRHAAGTRWAIPRRAAVLGLPGLLPGLRDQGPDVPVPHLAARRPRARRPPRAR